MKSLHDFRGELRAAKKRCRRAGAAFCRNPRDSRAYGAAHKLMTDRAAALADQLRARAKVADRA